VAFLIGDVACLGGSWKDSFGLVNLEPCCAGFGSCGFSGLLASSSLD